MSTENDIISGMDNQQIDQAINQTREQIEAQIKARGFDFQHLKTNLSQT